MKTNNVNWKAIAKQIYVELDDSTIKSIQEDWNKIEKSFLVLQKINVNHLQPINNCFKTLSCDCLRGDNPTTQTKDLFSKKKYFIG